MHLPFCAAKCTYCDFYSVAAEGHDLEGMVEAILVEARTRAPRGPRTLFLGGGTPSLLPGRLLRRLLEGLEDLTGFRGSADEVTVECNPESLDPAKARTLVELGATRLSIGVQSLHADVLALFGRVHGVEDSFRAYDAARAAGVGAVNVDVIFAAPGQTVPQWERDLERVIDLGPDHVAAYNLAFEEQTPFLRWLEQGRVERLPEELELELFWTTRRCLSRAGLNPYEISNFARMGHQCDHNVNYWENGPYAGLGPSGVAAWGGERRGNVRSVGDYVRRIRSGGEACAWSERLLPIDRLGETWWLGLRMTRGIDPERARAVAGLPPGEPGPDVAVAARLLEEDLLERAGQRVRLSLRGLPLADAVAREFLGL